MWRISGAELMSVGRGGRVYLGTHMSGRDSVRAVRFTNGSTVWQHGSRLPIAGVQELANGTVAVLCDTLADQRLQTLEHRYMSVGRIQAAPGGAPV